MSYYQVPNLFHRARATLLLSQLALAEALGASRRTGQRWDAAQAYPNYGQLETLARLVHPKDPGFAAEIANGLGTTLVELGLEPAPSPPVQAPSAQLPRTSSEQRRGHIVDSVVCAAAEAMNVLPGAIRPALLAAFTRASDLGLDIDAVVEGLAGKAQTKGGSQVADRKTQRTRG